MSEQESVEQVMQRLGRRVRALRQEKQWSQQRLAAEARVNMTYLSEIEHGKKNVTLEVMVKLAAALGVPVTTLLEVEAR